MSNSVLDAIKERDRIIYGEVCTNEHCGLRKKWCRCDSYEANKKSMANNTEHLYITHTHSDGNLWLKYYLSEEEDLNKRMDIIGRNGGDGEHYFSMSFEPKKNTFDISLEPVDKLEDVKSVNKVSKFFNWLWRIFK